MLHRDIAPEQHLAVVGLQQGVDLAQVVEVHRSLALRLDHGLGASLAQFKRLVRPDVQEGPRKRRRQLGKHLADEIQRGRHRRRQHVAVRHLDQVLELLVLQRQVHVAEGLLLRHHGHVVLAGEVHQLARIRRRHRAPRHPHQRQRLVGEGVLEVRRVEVDLVLGEQRHVALHRGQRRHRTAAQVVVHAAPPEARPVHYGHRRRHRTLLPFRVKELPQRLDAVKHPRRAVGHHAGLLRRHHQRVAFRLGRGRQRHGRPAQHRLARRARRPQQHDRRAADPELALDVVDRPQLLLQQRRRKAVLRATRRDRHRRPDVQAPPPQRHLARRRRQRRRLRRPRPQHQAQHQARLQERTASPGQQTPHPQPPQPA